MQSYIIKGAKVYLEQNFEYRDIVVINGVIKVVAEDIKLSQYNLPQLEFLSSDYIIPGFIDIHIHGSKGADVWMQMLVR